MRSLLLFLAACGATTANTPLENSTHVTATKPGDGCTREIHEAHVRVTRGSGTFKLTNKIVYEGQPHVTFYVGGQNAGGVYFGKDAFLKR